jgi:hypothetical protein
MGAVGMRALVTLTDVGRRAVALLLWRRWPDRRGRERDAAAHAYRSPAKAGDRRGDVVYLRPARHW